MVVASDLLPVRWQEVPHDRLRVSLGSQRDGTVRARAIGGIPARSEAMKPPSVPAAFGALSCATVGTTNTT